MSLQIKFPDIFANIFEPHRYKVFYGGRGSSKSHSVARYILIRSMQKPLRILCTRELQNSIKESVHKLFTELIEEYNLQSLFSVNQTSITCTLTGSEFIFAGLAKNTDALKSMEGIDICWVEEAERVSERSWELLIPTIRKPGSEIIITFNPVDEEDPVYQRFVVNTPPDTLLKQVNYTDNPWFPTVLQLEMEEMQKRDPERYEHVWLGKPRTQSDAQVFKGKIYSLDFVTPPDARFHFGADWGFGCDPCVLMRCFIRDRKLYIDYCWYEYGAELRHLEQKYATVPLSYRHPIYCDPTRPETIEFMCRPENGAYHCLPAKRWEGSIEDGVEYLRNFDAIIVHTRCRPVYDDFRRFSYKVDKHTDKVLPELNNKRDDAVAAARYALNDYIQQRTTIFGA